MAAIVEFGQRKKQKKEEEAAYVFESRIDDYLEELEEKEEIISKIDSYVERAIQEYGLDIPGFHLDDQSVRRFMSVPLELVKKNSEGAYLYYDRVSESDIIRLVMGISFVGNEHTVWSELYKIERYPVGERAWLYYAPDTGKWELGKNDFFPDIDEMLKRDNKND